MIRRALKEDKKEIAVLMIAAMGKLANQLRGSENNEDVIELFEYFIALKGNQYSFENVMVYVIDNKIVGAVNAYDGSEIEILRKPFLTYINKNYHTQPFVIESESEAGEFYIDTLSVNPSYQGRGIGKALLNATKDWAKKLGHLKIGLLVDFDNPDAKRLYLSVGFKENAFKILLDKKYEHLVCEC